MISNHALFPETECAWAGMASAVTLASGARVGLCLIYASFASSVLSSYIVELRESRHKPDKRDMWIAFVCSHPTRVPRVWLA
jgi:hypothetical protein